MDEREHGLGLAFVVLAQMAIGFWVAVAWAEEGWLTERDVGVGVLVVLLVGVAAYIAVHELGHAVAARLTGFRVFRLVVGRGPTLLSTHLGGTVVVLKLLPKEGYVQVATTRREGYQWRAVAVYLAGPLAGAAAGLLLLVALPTTGSLGAARLLLVAFVAVSTLGSLTPLVAQTQLGPLPTDGAQVRTVLREPDACFAAQQEWFHHLDVAHTAERHGAEAALAEVRAGRVGGEDPGRAADAEVGLLIEAGRHAEAWEVGVRHVGSDTGGPMAANGTAYAGLLLGDAALLPEIDRLSAFALAALPTEAAVLDTRGWTLVALGRPDEGMDLLRRALVGLPVENATAVRSHMLIGALAQGDLVTAKALVTHIRAIRTKDPSREIALARYREVVSGLDPETRAALDDIPRATRTPGVA